MTFLKIVEKYLRVGNIYKYFSTLSYKRHDFRKRKKKVIEHETCFGLSETFLTLRRTERDMIIRLYWSSCKVHIILNRFSSNLNYLNRFSKNTRISAFKMIRSVGVELFHADGRTGGHTDMTELTVALRNICERA